MKTIVAALIGIIGIVMFFATLAIGPTPTVIKHDTVTVTVQRVDTVHVVDTVYTIPAPLSLLKSNEMLALDFGDDIYDNHVRYHGIVVLQNGTLFAVHDSNDDAANQGYTHEMLLLEDYIGKLRAEKVARLLPTAKLVKYKFPAHSKVWSY